MTTEKLTIVFVLSVFVPLLTLAQERGGEGMMNGMRMNGMCPMCGPAGMILGGLLTIALIAALIALTIFLIRRSRK